MVSPASASHPSLVAELNRRSPASPPPPSTRTPGSQTAPTTATTNTTAAAAGIILRQGRKQVTVPSAAAPTNVASLGRPPYAAPLARGQERKRGVAAPARVRGAYLAVLHAASPGPQVRDVEALPAKEQQPK